MSSNMSYYFLLAKLIRYFLENFISLHIVVFLFLVFQAPTHRLGLSNSDGAAIVSWKSPNTIGVKEGSANSFPGYA
jgi:hypothetical protein